MSAKTAIVTGGGTGIGRATALALAERGFQVVIAGRRKDALDTAADAVRAQVSDAIIDPRPTDVGDGADPVALVDETHDRYGRLDVVVNAAGIYDPLESSRMTADEWDRTMDVVLRGAVLCSAAAARHMKKEGGGRIVLISSINGAISEPESAHYSAGKAALMSVARSMAVDFAQHAIAVNAIAPGWVNTPMTEGFLATASRDSLLRINPLGRAGDPDEIAGVIAYLATDAPMFLTGATIFVDGGQTAAAPMP